MTETKLTIDQLREKIRDGEAEDPLVFLEAVMVGKDPRGDSRLFELVQQIEDSMGLPDEQDWEELVALVEENYKYNTVSMNESLVASKELAQYVHPKKKQIDMNTTVSNGDASAMPLTEEDIELFKEVWNDEF